MNSLFLNIRVFLSISFLFITLCIRQFIILTLYLLVSKKIAIKFLDYRLRYDIHTVWTCLTFAFNFSFKYSIEAGVHLANNKSYILISNHQSLFDSIAILRLFTQYSKRPIRGIAKKSLTSRFSIFTPVTQIMETQGYAFIDRASGFQTIPIIRSLSKLSHSEFGSIFLFPEGTRSKDGTVQEFKTSAIRVALLDNPMPLAVIALDGALALNSIFRNKTQKRFEFKIKFLHVFEDTTKKNVKEHLIQSRAMIAKQLEEWKT